MVWGRATYLVTFPSLSPSAFPQCCLALSWDLLSSHTFFLLCKFHPWSITVFNWIPIYTSVRWALPCSLVVWSCAVPAVSWSRNMGIIEYGSGINDYGSWNAEKTKSRRSWRDPRRVLFVDWTLDKPARPRKESEIQLRRTRELVHRNGTRLLIREARRKVLLVATTAP